jgi:hypothetical protein
MYATRFLAQIMSLGHASNGPLSQLWQLEVLTCRERQSAALDRFGNLKFDLELEAVESSQLLAAAAGHRRGRCSSAMFVVGSAMAFGT